MDIVNLFGEAIQLPPDLCLVPQHGGWRQRPDAIRAADYLASELHQFPELDVIYKATYDRAKGIDRPDLIYLSLLCTWFRSYTECRLVGTKGA